MEHLQRRGGVVVRRLLDVVVEVNLHQCRCKMPDMRTTITIDDELFRKAMRVFVRIQSGKRLAALGGAAPRMRDIPRRRAAGRSAR
jgi:Bacterial antitoxin of type II TA system, VapB